MKQLPLFLATLAMIGTSYAQTPTAVRKDAQGRNVRVKLTGKYADCVRDGKKMGYSASAAADYCRKKGLR
jgi:hypothetical protein